MISWLAVAYAKYSLFLIKVLLAAVALVASPRFSTQIDSHGSSHATPASHGTADDHAAPAHADPAHPAPAHGDDHSAARSGHDDPHAATAHGDTADAHDGPAPVLGPTMWGLPLGVWHAINFFILFGAIFWFTRRALVASVRAKRDATAKNIEEATRLRDEMRKKFEDYDARMKNIDERMASIVAEAKTDSEAEMAKMVGEAGVVANRIREDAKLIADQEIARAKRELQDEQIARATELAEQILQANVTKEDQARLADEFMSRVAKEQPEGAARGWGSGGEAPGNSEGRA